MTVHKLLFSSDDFYKNLLIIPVTTQEAVTALKGQHRQTNCLFKGPKHQNSSILSMVLLINEQNTSDISM